MKIANLFILGFYSDTLFRTLKALKETRSQLNIHVLHNQSSRAAIINEQLYRCLELEQIDTILFFHENVAASAFGSVFSLDLIKLTAPFTIVSDGDVLPSEGWLKEHLEILEKHKDVFSVSTRLSLENLPGKITTMVPPSAEHQDYLEQRTGWVFKTFRTEEWREFLEFFEKSGIMFHDNEVYQYAKNYRRQKSVVTKKSFARHLRWDGLDDTRYELEKRALGDPWYHAKTSAITLTSTHGVKRYAALPKRPIRLQTWRRLIVKNLSEASFSVEIVYGRIDGAYRKERIECVESNSEGQFSLYSASKVSLWVHREGVKVYQGEHEILDSNVEVEII